MKLKKAESTYIFIAGKLVVFNFFSYYNDYLCTFFCDYFAEIIVDLFSYLQDALQCVLSCFDTISK